jgi:hypothetical protein
MQTWVSAVGVVGGGCVGWMHLTSGWNCGEITGWMLCNSEQQTTTLYGRWCGQWVMVAGEVDAPNNPALIMSRVQLSWDSAAQQLAERTRGRRTHPKQEERLHNLLRYALQSCRMPHKLTYWRGVLYRSCCITRWRIPCWHNHGHASTARRIASVGRKGHRAMRWCLSYYLSVLTIRKSVNISGLPPDVCCLTYAVSRDGLCTVLDIIRLRPTMFTSELDTFFHPNISANPQLQQLLVSHIYYECITRSCYASPKFPTSVCFDRPWTSTNQLWVLFPIALRINIQLTANS